MFFKNGIVITGLIASGKSSVCNILTNLGFDVICADKIAHQILDENQTLIAENFGENFIKQNKVDRKALGKFIFSNTKAKQTLENILHPLIYKEICNQAQNCESKNKKYFIDIPLFFESGGRQKYNFSKILLVYAPTEVCLERLLNRDNLEMQQALLRINSQMDIEKKINLADFVLENTSNLQNLEKNLKKILNKL